MCKYCKHLQEVRNLERNSYERVIAHLKKELRKDDKYFHRFMDLVEDLVSHVGFSEISLYYRYEYRDLCEFYNLIMSKKGREGGDEDA